MAPQGSTTIKGSKILEKGHIIASYSDETVFANVSFSHMHKSGVKKKKDVLS